ncbi:serine and arginine rich splicing factor 6a isoform X3 [Chanos chanos]|uniref:Serine and arginine rich splicing factor 6a isoform X3 n=1 Tax=Chanos chanos TaxID=29144 RepID=A0A6J2UXP5_CHACN|nr:serine/arginine-rich splicing factor 6 isoform X3 [Chanos chanos]
MPRVYIGRLSYHVREKDIQRFFSGYGKLLEVDLKNGYGFVEFEDTRDADDAVYELNGKELCGERVMVEHARGPRRDRDGYGGYSSRSRSGRDKYGPPVRTEYRLIVENLSSRCSWQDLKDFMRQAGEVTYADAHKERTNEGVIEFRTHSDMRRALEKLDGTDINGRKIRLIEDNRRRSRSRSRRSSRSRSRSRSHSRSRSRRRHSRSRSGRKSRSRSGRKSRSKSASRKSRSRTRKSRSRSRTRKSRSRSTSRKSRSRSDDRKSRSKSRSKVKSERDSRSRSKEKSTSKKSRSRSASPMENGKEERAKSASRSPSPQAEKSRSKSPDRHSRSRSKSGSRSKSRSRSRSASQD